MHHPLKQGLRQSPYGAMKALSNSGTSASSIKTRIKTNEIETSHDFKPCTSASSITTRIKTHNLITHHQNEVVRVHHPLKQGLRH